MTEPMKVKFSLDHADFLPRKAIADDAGFDLFSAMTIVCLPGKVTKVPLGIRAEIPSGYECQIRPKSGYTIKGLICVLGTIDAGFRGDWAASIHNTTEEPYTFNRGQKVAQAVFAEVLPVEIEATTGPLSDSERGEGGWGSTGI